MTDLPLLPQISPKYLDAKVEPPVIPGVCGCLNEQTEEVWGMQLSVLASGPLGRDVDYRVLNTCSWKLLTNLLSLGCLASQQLFELLKYEERL